MNECIQFLVTRAPKPLHHGTSDNTALSQDTVATMLGCIQPFIRYQFVYVSLMILIIFLVITCTCMLSLIVLSNRLFTVHVYSYSKTLPLLQPKA